MDSFSRKFRTLIVTATGLLVLAAFFAPWILDKPAATKAATGTTADFIQRCGGQSFNASNQERERAICNARISGFVSGYDLSLERLGPDAKKLHLWCVPDEQTDYISVIEGWAQAQPTRYAHVISTMKGSNDETIATALIIAGLHETYPCKENQ